MKTTFALLLLSISSSSVFSIDNNAEVLNFNLQNSAHVEVLAEATPRQQCFKQCSRRSNKSPSWHRNCSEKCNRRYPAPTPAPVEPAQPQCYNIGDPCDVDSDCLTGGFNPCNKCGTSHGTQYYKRCYSEPETPFPTPAPVEVGMCGQSCWNNADCKSQYVGTWNPCMVCSRNHGAQAGTRYMCIDPSTYEETEDMVFIESDEEDDEDGPTWDKIKNGTRRAADKTKEWGKNAGEKTAEGTKNAAEKTKEWGKKKFTDNSGYTTKSLVVAAGSYLALQVLLA
jgi:hypothetical protein